jgi:hypothetical protein
LGAQGNHARGLGRAGDDGRPEVIAILENLEEIPTLLVSNRREAPVVEHKDVSPGEPDQEPRIRPCGACQRQLMEQARGAPVERLIALLSAIM